MPPRKQDTSDELSLRHLPDSSDASFSFQIPNALSKGDLLLGDDDMSFFGGGNDSMATPGPCRTASKPLTLEELTPLPIRTHATTFFPDQRETSSIPVLDMPTKPKSKRTPQGVGRILRARLTKEEAKAGPKLMMQSSQTHATDHSSAATRLETLNAEVEKLDSIAYDESIDNTLSNHARPRHGVKSRPVERGKEPIAKPKRNVISGGISKIRSKNTSSTSMFPRHIPSVPNTQQHSLLHRKPHVQSDNADSIEDEENHDASICSTTIGGVAERLLMYGEKLMGSFGASTSENTASAPPISPDDSAQNESTPDPVNVHQFARRDDNPLTLSQLSPSKPASPLPIPPVSARPPSPMRTSRKRPASVAVASTDRAVKKGKGSFATTDKQSAAAAPALQKSAGVRAPMSSSSSGSRKAQATVRTRAERVSRKPTRQAPVSTITKPVNRSQAQVPAAQARNDASGSGSRTQPFSRSERLVTSGSSVKRREEGRATMSESANLPQGDKRVVLPPANPTKPAEFKFQLDARMEARKAEYEKELAVASQKSRKPSYQVPDFKTLHALHEAELALRKENIVPVIPLPLELNTDWRARERGKFDEHVREKEREMEEATEQRRREREENEEREIRELRKKAIPRAHDVPEWYRDAPRRKQREVDSNGD
ncbi:hypothetical protein FPV67DRAFT_1663968 [Lyophyllum atratum]|nr:hypothetical protein FPV67DRAFT_1663968 [Lyophyllum atratum]